MGHNKRWFGVGAACVVLMAGCAEQPASAAAVVGSERVAMDSIADQVQAINGVLGVPADAVDVRLTNAVVRNNIVYELVEQAAARAGVTVTQTAIDQRLADQIEFVGSPALLDQQAAQSGVAPDMIRTDIEVSLLATALADALAGGRELPQEARQALLIADVQAYSDQVGTTVNPRFGVWDVDSLAVVGDPDAPSQPGELSLLGTP